jgi:Protein of unknown function (DUF3584)
LKGNQTKYQLCRMLLVNAGTNKNVASGRVTAVDPRGGAAVLGDNGVGKTTTLRILPLFFGHLPSQIVAAGNGQEAMIRFVIPTDASALAFEYQRGSSNEADLRLAVIRRRADDPDVPFYRIYRCGYRKDLFVGDGRFLSDEETQAKAIQLGIQATAKLSTADYRSVILYTPATSKEREKLRRYGMEYSFGPRKLDNLDRVVAAMVKKHISFPDIVQVAVGLVQHDLGQGAERAKLTFKQGKGPIERWLNNRQACLDAFRLAGEVTDLESHIRAHGDAETRYRSSRADVGAVFKARKSESEQLVVRVGEVTSARTSVSEAEQLRKTELAEAAAAAARAATKARSEYEEAEGTAQAFQEADAAGWERRAIELPSLRTNLNTSREQLEAAEAKHHEAKNRYGQLENDARNGANKGSFDLERGKEAHRAREAAAQREISAAETEALKLCADELAAHQDQLEAATEPLIAQRGLWEGRKSSPAATAESTAELEVANATLVKHMEAAVLVAAANEKAKDRLRTALNIFQAQELSVAEARVAVGKAQSALEDERRRMTPPEGSLLAALRASPDNSWTRTLAKVIDPALLPRDNLEPDLVDTEEQTLYGWRLNVTALPSPDWADLEAVQKALDAAEERLVASQARLQAELGRLTGAAQAHHEAQGESKTAQANLTVSNQHGVERRNQQALVQQRVESERRGAVARADAELIKISAALAILKQQRQSIVAQNAKSRLTVKSTFDAQRAEAKAALTASLQAIDAAIEKSKAELEAKILEIQTQLAEHLSTQGVDVAKLGRLKTECDRLKGEISAREERSGLLERWKKWVEAGESRTVENLRGLAAKTASASTEATQKVSEHAAAIDKSERAYQEALGSLTKRQGHVKDDLETLEELNESFGDYLALGGSIIDPASDVRELKSRVRAIRSEMEQGESHVTRMTTSLRQKLTTRVSSVREFVEATLGVVENGSPVSRGLALCHCYKQIGAQVASDVNITLKTLLANIDAFQKAILSFERAVDSFNTLLQGGLNDVKCFERVQDLHMDIVTNFENLGFYKKLSKMNDVVRRHANEDGKDYTRELPPDETARALTDLMSVLGSDGNVEVNLAAHITLKGSVSDNGQRKEFKRASQLENISSEGLTSLVLVTLMTALLNTIRGTDPVHVPWVTDEVGRFDPKNFVALMERLRDNRIDVVTASPELGPAQQAMFAHRYIFEDRGVIRDFKPAKRSVEAANAEATS